uniref:histidine kinase n=1 Tax=Desulfobacca acetoxidans TaxID=60893 RepID=A0A7V6A662_9BACT
MRPKSFFGQIYLALLIIALLSVVAITWIASRSWRHFYLDELAGDLKAQARLASIMVGEKLAQGEIGGLDEFCKNFGKLSDTRLTVVLKSGRVVGDSFRDISTMDDLDNRPEIEAALAGKVGQDQRQAGGQLMMYLAVPAMEQGKPVAAVRAALPLGHIRQALSAVYLKVGLGSLGIIFLGAGVSLVLSRRLTRPLEEFRRGAERFARGDLSLKLPRPDLAELVGLGETMNHMAAQLDERIGTIIRQRQEQEAVLASMVEGVIAVDSRSRIISLNRAAANLLGMDPAFVIQRSMNEVVENPDLQWFITRSLAASETIEGEINLHGDKPRFLQAHGTTLKDSQGKAFGVLIVVHDVTRLRQLENARRDFVANVSHELKTPITSIKGFVETLLEGAMLDPDHAEEFLRIIGRQADRLGAIIEDLLSLSRIEQEAEQGKIHLVGRKIRTILKAAIQACNTRSAEKKIAVNLDCPEDLRARINGPLLEQALINLIDNAVKYSDPGSLITVQAHKEDGQVVINVKDQGVGIAKEHLPRLFERFYRVDPSRSRKVGGTGLGLAIVKHIAQAHGGKVGVESTPGQGSTFTIVLQDDRGDL